MRINLKTAVNLGGGDLRPGSHEVPDHLRNHWFVRALEKDGKLDVIQGPEKAAEVEGIGVKKAEEPVASEKAPESEPVPAPEKEPEPEAKKPSDAKEGQKQAKKKG